VKIIYHMIKHFALVSAFITVPTSNYIKETLFSVFFKWRRWIM